MVFPQIVFFWVLMGSKIGCLRPPGVKHRCLRYFFGDLIFKIPWTPGLLYYLLEPWLGRGRAAFQGGSRGAAPHSQTNQLIYTYTYSFKTVEQGSKTIKNA